ncbi:MAG: hypothetical protein ACI33J_08205 [Clostridium sp.]
MKRKKGSFLIEAIISLSIVVLILSILPGTISKAELSSSSRYKIFKVNESIVAISKELKYNNSYEEIKNKLQTEGIKIAYSEKFLDEILEKNLFNMEKTLEENNFIKINITNEESRFMKIKIEVNVNIQGSTKKIEHIVLKDKWMDYVY